MHYTVGQVTSNMLYTDAFLGPCGITIAHATVNRGFILLCAVGYVINTDPFETLRCELCHDAHHSGNVL